MSLVQLLSDKVFGMAARYCQRAVADRLRVSGLRYEDLINEEDNDFKEALSLASPEVQTSRTRRLKRALDLNVKQKNFLDYCPDVEQDTFKFEVYQDFLKIRARNQEYAILNQYKK